MHNLRIVAANIMGRLQMQRPYLSFKLNMYIGLQIIANVGNKPVY
jgi:hypothetical protein